LVISVCAPFAISVVFHEYDIGPLVALRASAPSIYNSILTTPTLSDAEAVTVTVPETVAPEAGELIEVVGGVVSGVPLEPIIETSSMRNVVGSA
jgi:hypothetical protein